MKAHILKKIKSSLTQEKNMLLAKSHPIEIDMEGDETDQIQGKIIATVTQELSTRDFNKIKQIDIALKKIEDETFGLCENCGEQIAEKRLEYNPHFANCISCAEEIEFLSRRK